MKKKKAKIIDSFSGEYSFLSNFYFLPELIKVKGFECTTAEHGYQLLKATNDTDRSLIATSPTPSGARLIGNKIIIRKNWKKIKVKEMRKILEKKFTIPKLERKLLSTGDAKLIEGNWWGDMFWGVCNGSGKNILGKLLMEIREDLFEEEI